MPRTPNFYFGTAVFFIGVLMTAIGVENLVIGRSDFIIFAALIFGIVLVLIGYIVGKRKGAQDLSSER